MLRKKNLAEEKKSTRSKHKGNLECFITTSVITLLMLLGFFTSHYNKDNFIGGMEGNNPSLISSDANDKTENTVYIKQTDTTLKENLAPPVFIFGAPSKPKSTTTE